VYFETVGLRTLGSSSMEGFRCGALVWEITGSDGAFHESRGHITSNFCANDNDEVWGDNDARISTA